MTTLPMTTTGAVRRPRPGPPDLAAGATRAAAVPVRTGCRRVPFADPLAMYRALAHHFGEREVFLLESRSARTPAEAVPGAANRNPRADGAQDARYAYLGVGPVLSVSVTQERVDVAGTPVLAGVVRDAVSDLLAVDGHGPWLPDQRRLWDLLRRVRAVFDAEGTTDRFTFGFLTFFGYDTARYVEQLPWRIDHRPDGPDVAVVLHRSHVRVDLLTGTAELLTHRSPAWDDPPVADLEAALAECAATPANGMAAAANGPAGTADDDAECPGVCPPVSVTDELTQARFAADVRRCLHHIEVGDIYQVQIGHDLVVHSHATPLDVYRRLRSRNPSPYMFLCPLGDQTLIGASPELFVRVTDGAIVMRPIAGTVPRPGRHHDDRAGDDRADEQRAAARLRNDPKEVAEHVMLVDLCRNDIGRVCRGDSLTTGELLEVETYSHVLHLVSTVAGRVDEHADSFEVIRALFPAGTMTGAPKIRAMEIIESVEASRRGLYAGAVGLVDVAGHVNLALVIRTLFHRDERYRIRASAGVVADSEPGREWRESLVKMSAPYWAVTGTELAP
ncbi:anthranilate synthase component I [Dactylosporangium fulvum]|uniref:Anthranilate synthase component I family protein n=1 Tax=Dactylosporangium fulvum TaxID=53359 RepID=A0ABY5VWF8_9ACTN|nr:anthranilate synthase component I family protein [Dactylosporangium fulvum]UWP80126.1 anthranilate synthase component I family protein [Dactylosporangium fulvum]